MTVTTDAPAAADVFAHPALFYRGRREYLAATVPFVRAGLAAGDPVAVAVPGPNLALMRDELGAAADSVRFLDMTRVGRNPGRIIPGVLRAFADAHPDSRVRIIGEPIWPERTEVEYPACVQHEALINMAFAGRTVTILCPYDADRLDPVVLTDAAATHPVLIDDTGERVSTDYEPRAIVSAYNTQLPPPPSDAAVLGFDIGSLSIVRAFAVDHATRLGLAIDRAEDLELIVNELASNTVVHGGGVGTLRIWTERAQIGCEVTDGGRIADPLVGRIPVGLDREGGRGLLLVNYLADLVRVHTTDTGTTIRLYLTI